MGHDLLGFGNALADAVERPLPDDLLGASRRLSDHYIRARYPDAHPGGSPGDRYTPSDGARALADVEMIMAAVDEMWSRLEEEERGGGDRRARVIERRRAQQRALLARAGEFAASLDPALGVRAVVVFGSVARGDFNVWSDIDVLVVADELPEPSLDRLGALGPRPPLVQPVAWTPAELRRELDRANPIAGEAMEHGVWLTGSAEGLGRR